MSKKWTAKDVASDYWEYIQSWMLFLDKNAGVPGFNTTAVGIYGYESRRTEYHDRVCEALGISKENTKEITDNIDRYGCFDDFYEALVRLKGGTR